jgi:hypothetical protein
MPAHVFVTMQPRPSMMPPHCCTQIGLLWWQATRQHVASATMLIGHADIANTLHNKWCCNSVSSSQPAPTCVYSW